MKHNERLAILGGVSSGAGVLIRTMLGLHKHVSGDIVIDGKHISNILRDYKKLHGVVGYQPQQNSIDEELSVLQHLNLFAKLGGIESEHIESEVNKMLDAC